jgi:hypothetical protein
MSCLYPSYNRPPEDRAKSLGGVHDNLRGSLPSDSATRMGALALLISSIVALLTATALSLLKKSAHVRFILVQPQEGLRRVPC